MITRDNVGYLIFQKKYMKKNFNKRQKNDENYVELIPFFPFVFQKKKKKKMKTFRFV